MNIFEFRLSLEMIRQYKSGILDNVVAPFSYYHGPQHPQHGHHHQPPHGHHHQPEAVIVHHHIGGYAFGGHNWW